MTIELAPAAHDRLVASMTVAEAEAAGRDWRGRIHRFMGCEVYVTERVRSWQLLYARGEYGPAVASGKRDEVWAALTERTRA